MLLCGCASIVEVSSIGSMDIEDGVSKIVRDIVHVGKYEPDMDSGDRFIYMLPLGIPFDTENTFATIKYVENVINGDLEAIDKMYVFSKLTDVILACDSVLHVTNMRLSDVYFVDKDLHKLTSPTYNDDFLFSTVYPLVTDSSVVWTSFNHVIDHDAITVARGKQCKISVPLLKAMGNISVMPICRPWLEENDIKKNIHIDKLAIVEGIILSKKLNISFMKKTLKAKIYKSRQKRIRIIGNPVSTSVTYPECIIGYYCRIL